MKTLILEFTKDNIIYSTTTTQIIVEYCSHMLTGK